MKRLPRGKYIGWQVGGPPAENESEHFMRCPVCGGWIDCRDLGQVFDHHGPDAPHPKEDREQE